MLCGNVTAFNSINLSSNDNITYFSTESHIFFNLGFLNLYCNKGFTMKKIFIAIFLLTGFLCADQMFLSLKQKEPNWRAEIIKSFSNGAPEIVISKFTSMREPMFFDAAPSSSTTSSCGP
jgi:hypothetical protein